jgi:very-short-patch-repair endonuclease
MGRFITDFYCDDARLVIEVDGAVHLEASQRERDDARDAAMRKFELEVLRFTNTDVLSDIEAVVETIARYVEAHRYGAPSPSPSPSPSPALRRRGAETGNQ